MNPKSISAKKYVGAPPPGYFYTSNFDTIWGVTFTLNVASVESASETSGSATNLFSSNSSPELMAEENESVP